MDYYCLNGELNLAFDKAFAYSGDKNLLVTITFDGDETAETSSDIEFYYNTDAENMAMSTNSDNVTFADYHESEDWPYAKGALAVRVYSLSTFSASMFRVYFPSASLVTSYFVSPLVDGY